MVVGALFRSTWALLCYLVNRCLRLLVKALLAIGRLTEGHLVALLWYSLWWWSTIQTRNLWLIISNFLLGVKLVLMLATDVTDVVRESDQTIFAIVFVNDYAPVHRVIGRRLIIALVWWRRQFLSLFARLARAAVCGLRRLTFCCKIYRLV